MNNERIFAAAQYKAQLGAEQAARDWSDKIDTELLAMFTALDAMGAPVKAAVIAESILSEFDCFPPRADDMEPLWLSEEAVEVLRCINAFNEAFAADRNAKAARRKLRLAVEMGA